eukprot:6036838-Alexandrium_andersonii.AAC.1
MCSTPAGRLATLLPSCVVVDVTPTSVAVTHPCIACSQVASVATTARAALARGECLRFADLVRCSPQDAAALFLLFHI